jgi:hypothetical protein
MRRLCPFNTETDPAALQEISDSLHKALILSPQGHPERWSCLAQLADLAALQRDWTTAIENLQEAVDSPAYDNIDRLLSDVFRILDSLGIKDMCHEQRRSVLKRYRSALGLTTLAVGVAIDTSTQLRHIYQGSTIGSRAFTLANMVGDLEAGLQLVEHTHGVLWSQALHLQHPDIGRVPHEHAKKLKDLLSSINAPLPTANFDVGERRPAFLIERDSQYSRRFQFQEVVRDIRSLPDLRDFMRGPDANALKITAARGPVVVLVASDNECRALVIASPHTPMVNIPIGSINEETLQDLTLTGLSGRKRGSLPDTNTERGMRMSIGMLPSHLILARLWRSVVKPVITHLGLQVSADVNHSDVSRN